MLHWVLRCALAIIAPEMFQQRGLIGKSPAASLGMRDLARDFAHCSSGSGAT